MPSPSNNKSDQDEKAFINKFEDKNLAVTTHKQHLSPSSTDDNSLLHLFPIENRDGVNLNMFRISNVLQGRPSVMNASVKKENLSKQTVVELVNNKTVEAGNGTATDDAAAANDNVKNDAVAAKDNSVADALAAANDNSVAADNMMSDSGAAISIEIPAAGKCIRGATDPKDIAEASATDPKDTAEATNDDSENVENPIRQRDGSLLMLKRGKDTEKGEDADTFDNHSSAEGEELASSTDAQLISTGVYSILFMKS